MDSDIVPVGESTWSNVLKQFNVPKVLLGPAGEAISRLIGHAADIPAEYIANISQGIKDKREARTEVSKALAKAVATDVIGDKALLQRAAQSFLAKEFRSQTNKEAVAHKAIEHLSDGPDVIQGEAQSLDDDWINIFERYAENASSERLRDLWGRVLAKEIRKPKSFSLRTMRFISELDGETARIFQKHSAGIIDGDFLLKPYNLIDPLLGELLSLEDAGLIVGTQGSLSREYTEDKPDRDVHIIFNFHTLAVAAICEVGARISFPNLLLTNTGKEILKIVEPADDREFVNNLIATIDKSRVRRLLVGRRTATHGKLEQVETAWEASTQ
ncbi:MAG: DUF2806 domain-containing protein [Xanthobacteraceae bacterium]